METDKMVKEMIKNDGVWRCVMERLIETNNL